MESVKRAKTDLPCKEAEGKTTGAVEGQRKQSEVLEFWKSEVALLRSAEFETFDQAIETVIARTLDRMQVKEGKDEMGAFLKQLILSDPELKECLNQTLRIGR